MLLSKKIYDRRKQKVRYKLRQSNNGRPRLSVYRSGAHIYAQLIDDLKGCTLAAASTLEKETKSKLKNTSNVEAARFVGKLVAQRGVKAGVTEVIFDRAGYLYHGRVRALAEAARENGLSF